MYTIIKRLKEMGIIKMGTLIRNGHLVDVEADRDGLFDIFVNDEGKVGKVEKQGNLDSYIKENTTMIDAKQALWQRQGEDILLL